MIESWTPLFDVVLLLAVSVIAVAVIALVQMVRMWRESRDREARIRERLLGRLWAEAADLYRDDPMGGRTARWEPRCPVCLDRAEFADGRCVCEVSR